MPVRTAVVRWSAWLALAPLLPAQAPLVSETKLVIAEDGKHKEFLRKINGRWWSQDNREVYPPKKDGIFWTLDSQAGTCEFYHHRPFRIDRAESLRLWMSKEEVQAALGQPNRTLGRGDSGFWYYYAADGVELQVRFMSEGVLGEAKYFDADEKSWPVASIEAELGGRDIYKLLQQRANEKLHATEQERRAVMPRRGMRQSSQPSVVVLDSSNVPAAAEPPAPVSTRVVSGEAVAAIAPGATREDVLNRLGEPRYRYSITGDGAVHESFRYVLDNGESVTIALLDGKVAEVRQ